MDIPKVPDYLDRTMPKGYWLAKSEPESYSIADLERDGRTAWEGVRNYMARNYLRAMKAGDLVLFYHSNADPSGVAGVAKVSRAAYPDKTALDSDSKYHDPKATADDLRWSVVDLAFVEAFADVLPLEVLKDDPGLVGMEVTRRGSRLSVSPVSATQFARVKKLARSKRRRR